MTLRLVEARSGPSRVAIPKLSIENCAFERYPGIVATGFTAAYLGDERSLREFIVGDHLREQITQTMGSCILYLINDSYDALTYRQLRVALNKDEKLLALFEHYCGRPIAEVPDPFECHESYSQHFIDALLQRLRSLDIHPVVLDTYQAYRNGYYDDFISTTLENYSGIQEAVARKFAPFTIHNLLHLKCSRCQCIDSTYIRRLIKGRIRVECERCGQNAWYENKEFQGKLSWKLNCAARWNLYGIDIEPFSKDHLNPTGTFYIAQFISKNFFGGHVPVPVRYGTVQISKEISSRLLEILPPEVLKELFIRYPVRDISLTKNSVEQFCRQVMVKPGLSYVDYVQTELPKQALRLAFWNAGTNFSKPTPVSCSPEEKLAFYGKRFCKFYYDRDYQLRFPDARTIASADKATVRLARDLIRYAISLRDERHVSDESLSARIGEYLRARDRISIEVLHYIRRILGQPMGPRLSMILALLPRDYLDMLEAVLGFYTGMPLPAEELPKASCWA